MNPNSLIANLQNPRPAIRLDVIRVLGLVEETAALDALRERLKAEALPELKEAVLWAGRRIHAAAGRGHSTQASLFQHFGIDREIAQAQDDPEADLLRKLDESLQLEMMRRQRDAAQHKTNLAAGALAASAALGAAGLPVPGPSMGSLLQAGADVASSNLGETRPQIGTNRIPAIRPASTDISLWIKRAQTDPDPETRITAIRQLREINNPAALPRLAAIFLSDPEAVVRQAAEAAGKHLYWNAVYWRMEQDGTLAEAMAARKQALGQPASAPVTPPAAETASPAAAEQENVADILRRAEAARQRRQKNRE
jgi:HEAT repeat protein